jgi:hypothetical protein
MSNVRAFNAIGMVFILLLGAATAAYAGPVITFDAEYRNSNRCPTDGDMDADSDLTVQYQVDAAIRCMYITNVSNGGGNIENPVGTDDEADAFLNLWGSVDFVGLGSTDGGIDGFTYTSVGGKTGTFEIGGDLLDDYNQFVVALKDGGDPKFAMFLLPIGVYESAWSFESQQGSISHFALFGRDATNCPDCEIDPRVVVTPEPASMIMLGTGLLFGARKVRQRQRKA